MENKPCTREDLQAAVSIYYMFDTKGEGELGDEWQEWDDPGYSATENIEEYHCRNCGEYFTPTDKATDEALARAWRAALKHLKVEQTKA